MKKRKSILYSFVFILICSSFISCLNLFGESTYKPVRTGTFKVEDSDGDGIISVGEKAKIYASFYLKTNSTIYVNLNVDSEYIDFSTKGSCTYNDSQLDTYYTLIGTENIPKGKITTIPITYTIKYDNKEYSYDYEVKCTNIFPSISKEYWGTWIQMDTGAEYYIDSEKIYAIKNNSNSEIQRGVAGYTLDGENILCKDNTRYFRKGGSSRNFSISVSGFDNNGQRAAGTDDVKIKRKNKKNPDDMQILTPDASGKTLFTGSIADDAQEIKIISGLSENTSDTDSYSVSVTPSYNGQDMGTIPIVEKGMYGFKVTYSINSDGQGLLYGNYYTSYNLTLDINNIGSETCSTSLYSISTNDSALEFISGDLNGNFTSIEPGKSKKVSLKIRYGKLEKEYVDVPIRISIQDSKYSRTWNDCVTLRFYKGLVSLKINSRNFDSNSSAKLNGFVIYPDGRSSRFTVSAGNTTTVQVPWSQSDYHLAFSGATVTNEMAYSFGFSKKADLADLSGIWSISDINSYEPNDKIGTAKKITDLTSPIKSYLKDGDIDFYTINNSDIEIKFEPVVYSAHAVNDATSDSDANNGDNSVNPGETIGMDVKLYNTTSQVISGVTATLSTSSEYITIENPTKNYGDINSNYYKTLYGRHDSNSNYAYMDASYGWKFSVAANTPANTKIPFTLSFSDSHGTTWTDTFSVTVKKVDVNLVYSKRSISDSYSETFTLNNGDGLINHGETIKMDVQIQNTGKSLAQGISATLSTESEYVTIANPTKSYDDIKAGYYKTLRGYHESNSNYAYMDSSYGWQFTVAENTPDDTEIPFTLTFSDSHNNTWTDTFNVKVVKVDVNLVYTKHSLNDSNSETTPLNNGDGSINPGETIKMDVQVQNKGKSLALGINAVLSTECEYITIPNPTKSYGDIKGGYYRTLRGYHESNSNYAYMDSSYGWQFTVSEDAQTGIKIPFTLTFTDSNNNTWSDTFSLNLEKVDVDLAYSKRSINDSYSESNTKNNGDGYINPGETIKMDVQIQNKGKSLAQGLNVVLSTESEYVTIDNPKKSYGDIKGGYYKTLRGYHESNSNYAYLDSSYGWQFTVSGDTPADTEIPFTMTFTDSHNNTWSETFSIKVKKADVKIVQAGYSWDDSKSVSSANNDDWGYNAGETINWDIRIKNEGSATARNLICKLSSTSEYITFSDNICAYGTLNSNYYKTSYTASNSTGYSNESGASFYVKSYPGYVFTIDSSTPANTKIPILMTITDSQQNTWTDTITITVVEPYVELTYVNYAFSDKMVSGKMNDDDGIIEAGEQIYMNVCIKSSGTSRADNVKLSFSSTSEYVSFSTSSRDYGTIQANRFKAFNLNTSNKEITEMAPENNYACCFTISNTTPSGTVIPIKIKMADGNNNTFYHTLELLIQ